jgi:hypothetical protein
MSFIRAEAVTGFTFGLVNKTSGAALTGAAAGVGKFITKDGGTQASIAGSIAEEGNGKYSVDVTSSRPPSNSLPNHNTKCLGYPTTGTPGKENTSRPPSTSLPNHNTKCLVRRGSYLAKS